MALMATSSAFATLASFGDIVKYPPGMGMMQRYNAEMDRVGDDKSLQSAVRTGSWDYPTRLVISKFYKLIGRR